MKAKNKLIYSLISVVAIVIFAGGVVYATSISDKGKEIGQQVSDIDNNGSDNVVATIDGQQISQKSFDKYKVLLNLTRTYSDKEVLDKMIERRVLVAQAKADGFEVSAEEISSAVDIAKAALQQDNEQYEFLKSYLDGMGISEDQYWGEIVPEDYKQVLAVNKLYTSMRTKFVESNGLSDPSEIKSKFDVLWKEYINTLVSNAIVETSIK